MPSSQTFGESSLRLCVCILNQCVCVCVCRVMSVGVCEAGSWSAISHWILSRCPDTGRSSAGLWGQQRGLLLQDSHSSYPQTAHCTADHCASRWPIFLSNYRSVSLKLGGQLSKMITVCIKHAAVSNFSFPSSVFPPQPHSSLPHFFLVDPMGEEHHAWGTSRIFTLMVVVRIVDFFLSCPHIHTFAF